MNRKDYIALKKDLSVLCLEYDNFVYDTLGCEINPLMHFEAFEETWQYVSNEIDDFLERAKKILVNQVYADSFSKLGIEHPLYCNSNDVKRIVKLDGDKVRNLPDAEQETAKRKKQYEYIINWYPKRIMIVFKEMCKYEEGEREEELPDKKQFQSDKPYIFISYCHQNIDLVMPLIDELQKKYNIWYDDAISPASEWADVIADKLKNCTALLFAVTKESLESTNCKDEIHFARDNQKIILNVIFDRDMNLPDWFQLRFGRYQQMFIDQSLPLKSMIETLELKAEWLTKVAK